MKNSRKQLLHHMVEGNQLAEVRVNYNEATNIVIALDGFPLALDQAGAYIEETRCSFQEYLQLYQDHRQALLARRGTQATHYVDSVATTWSLSFQQVEQSNPAAAELLQLCAFLAPDAIPEELLRNSAIHWPSLLQQAATDLLAYNQMLQDLLRFSLIKRRVEQHTLSIHRLVQVIQQDQMSSEKQRQWAERAVRAVNEAFPREVKEDVTTWPRCARYLEQAQACDTLIARYQLNLSEAADLLEHAGTYLEQHASYALAESLYQRTLVMREQQAGPTPSLNNAWVLITLKRGKLGRTIAACSNDYKNYKIPRYVKFVDNFPMTVTGKVQKFLMRQQSIEKLGLHKAASLETA